MNKEKIIKAGRIASETKRYAKEIVKRDTPLLEIAEKLEKKIEELGGKPAFPINLSINNVAAHYTPAHDDKTLAHGLLKVDLGVHIDGWVADTALSIDLENSEENRKLIEASKEALENALDLIKLRTEAKKAKIQLNEIGKAVQTAIESFKFSPMVNLSGHSIEQYDLHSGTTIPNVDNGTGVNLEPGLYAIEPFATNGSGKVHDGKKSNIYHLLNEKTPRSQIAREVLAFIAKEYKTLPFCSRWLVKKLGTKSLLGLRELESNGNLYHFSQLVDGSDSNNVKVSQAEQTILIEKDKVTITTL